MYVLLPNIIWKILTNEKTILWLVNLICQIDYLKDFEGANLVIIFNNDLLWYYNYEKDYIDDSTTDILSVLWGSMHNCITWAVLWRSKPDRIYLDHVEDLL